MERSRSPSPGSRSDEAYRVSVLVNRATASASNREKNTFLNQLRKISNDQLTRLDAIYEQNEQKKRTLEALQKEYQDFQARMEIMNLRVATFQLLKKRGNLVILQNSAESIRDLEKEIASFGPVEKPQLVQKSLDRSDLSEAEKAILLDDIRTQRIEELIHFLERRLLSFEMNHEYAEQIMAEFGSVFRLIDVHRTFQMENEKLKNYESNFAEDAVTRRRISSKIGAIAARTMALLFQGELRFEHFSLDVLGASDRVDICRANSFSKFSTRGQHQKRVLKTRSVIRQGMLDAPPRPSTTVDAFMNMKLNFDEVCKDPEFKMTTDVTIMPSGMADTPQILKLPAQEAILAIEGQSKLVQDQLDQLEKTLAQKRESPVLADTSSRSRQTKMETSVQQLLEDMVRIQNEITRKNLEVVDVLKKLERALSEKNACEANYLSCFDPFRDLISEHNQLRERQGNNRAVVETLYSTCCLLGNELLSDSDEIDTPLSQLLLPEFEEQISALKEEARIREEENKKPAKTRKRKVTSKKGSGLTIAQQFARIMGKPEILESARTARSRMDPESARSEMAQSARAEAKRPRDKFPLLSMLTQAVECGGCLGKPNAWHRKFNALWKDAEERVRALLSEHLASYEEWQRGTLETMHKYSSNVLVKSYSTVEVQTAEVEMGEEETQTIDFKAEKKAAAEAKRNQKRSAKGAPSKK